MSNIILEKIPFLIQEPFDMPAWDEVILPPVEWSQVAGAGAPDSYANVTGDHIFRQTSAPTSRQGAKEGDLWFDTDDYNKPYKLVNGSWTSVQDGTILASGLQGWANNLVFSATDYNTVAWGEGTITLSNGLSYSIIAGNTGNITAVTYIFLDITISTTVLQTTTTASSAVGLNRILVAVASPNSDTAKSAAFQVFGGFGQSVVITADVIAANTITGNEIAANTITANKLSVATLSAITADLGTITAGTITGGTIQTAASGARVVMDSTGIKWYDATTQRGQILNDGSGWLGTSTSLSWTALGVLSVDGQYLLAASVASASADLALRGWTQTCAFSITDADTVAWGAGTFTASDGTAYSIDAGNTGNMVAKTYIYLDIAVSTTAYQTTTTAATAVGNGKVMVAIAQNGTGEATYFLLNNNSYNIDAANIVAGSITVNEIATNTITADRMNVTTLSAISATLGSVIVGTGGYIRQGQTDYNTGTGWWIGDVATVPKLSIGDGTITKSLTWDGTNLIVNGSPISSNTFYGDGSDGDVTISSNTTLTRDMFYNDLTVNATFTLNTGSYRIFVKGTLTNNGTIARNGNNGGNGGNGGDGSYIGPTAGTAGTAGSAGGALASGSIYGSAVGIAGKAGNAGTTSGEGIGTDGTAGTAGSAGTSVTKSFGNAGVAGAAGATTGSTYSPLVRIAGIGGALGAAGTQSGTVFNIPRLASAGYLLFDSLPSGDSIRSASGSGGGGGSGGAPTAAIGEGSRCASGGSGGTGGSGSSGGIVVIFARSIVNSATGIISANGGTGGNGGNGGASSVSPSGNNAAAGSAGGSAGSGGTGGIVLLIYNSLTNSGTISASAGAAGTIGTKGTAVVSGSGVATNGSDGNAGNAGNAGQVIYLQN